MKDPTDMTREELEEEVFRLRDALDIQEAKEVEIALGARWRMTKVEGRLAELLWRARGRCVTRDFMWATVWTSPEPPLVKFIDVLVCKVRKKMGGAMSSRIETVWGQGYRMTPLALAESDAAMDAQVHVAEAA